MFLWLGVDEKSNEKNQQFIATLLHPSRVCPISIRKLTANRKIKFFATTLSLLRSPARLNLERIRHGEARFPEIPAIQIFVLEFQFSETFYLRARLSDALFSDNSHLRPVFFFWGRMWTLHTKTPPKSPKFTRFSQVWQKLGLQVGHIGFEKCQSQTNVKSNVIFVSSFCLIKRSSGSIHSILLVTPIFSTV